MKKIFFGLFLLFFSTSIRAANPIYWTIDETAAVKGEDKRKVCNGTNVCSVGGIFNQYYPNEKIEIIWNIEKKYFLVFENVNKPYQKHWSNYLTFADFGDGTFLSATKTMLEAENIVNKIQEPIRLVEQEKRLKEDKINQKKLEEEQLQSRLKYLENTFGSKCLRYKANNTEYNKCLNDQEQIAKKEKVLQEAKQAEENKKKQLIIEKQKAEEERANRLLASMKPEERRSYICEKTYGFRKGSDKFGDCVFKIMAADLEIEKLEMQRKITEAQIEANKKSSTSYDPSVGRAAARAVDIEAARFKREQELETARLAFALSKGLGTPGGINSKIQGTADALNPNQRQAPAQNNNPFPKQTYCKLNPINNRISCYTQ